MCLRSVQYSKLNNNFLNRWMRPVQGPIIILTHQCTILAGEITRISHGAKITMTTLGQIMQATSIKSIILPIINPTFSTKLNNLPSKILHLRRKWLIFEKNMKRYMKNQESLMQTIQNSHTQAITRLEIQMSQPTNLQNERLKGSLPSQPVMNPRNSQQAYLAEDQPLNQCNVVHTLKQERKLIIKYQHHLIPFSTATIKHPPHLIPILPNLTNLTNLKQISQPVRCTSL